MRCCTGNEGVSAFGNSHPKGLFYPPFNVTNIVKTAKMLHLIGLGLADETDVLGQRSGTD